MPKTTRSGKADKQELPSTLQRSPAKAQGTFAKVHDAAAQQYGEGERAHRTAYAALKHSFEKVGDSWEPKDHQGPSDARSEQSGKAARDSTTPTAGGVDAHASKKHLYEVARRLDVPGRSSMNKDELVTAIGRANDRASSNARTTEPAQPPRTVRRISASSSSARLRADRTGRAQCARSKAMALGHHREQTRIGWSGRRSCTVSAPRLPT